jgi:hypothetical protein
MLDDAAQNGDAALQLAIVVNYVAVRRSRGIFYGVGVSASIHQDHRLHLRNHGKAEICGGRRGSSSPRGFPSFFGGGLAGGGDGAHL